MEFITKTVGDVLSDVANVFPNKEAIKYTDRNYTRTWKEFNDEAELIGRGLLALGIKRGDHVAIWATNTPEWLLTLFATAKIGAVLVTVNTNYKIFELEYLLRQSDSKMLIMIGGFKGNDYVSIVRELLPELDSCASEINNKHLPHLKRIVFAGSNTPEGMLNFEDLKVLGQDYPLELFVKNAKALNIHDTINIQYTSGTTGFPKGVMLSHYNILNNGKAIGDCMRFTEKDKLCIVVPFFHCFGLVLAVMACLTHSTSMVPVERFSPIPVMSAIENEKCTAFHGVPTMFIAMLEHPQFKQFDFSSLRTGIMAGSPCPIKVMQQVIDEMNMKEITIAFGQTEASPVCTQTTIDDSIELRVSTVGKLLPGIEGKIINPETNEKVPIGTAGEFCARGYNIMKGYYNMPEATAQAIDKDGWLHFGDLATVDENGYYKIVGRIKDMIIRGGENIYPKEIEELLYTNPEISDVQVIGVPSANYGEEVMAVIILKENSKATEDDIKEFVKDRMARHKVPKYIRFVDEFPVTASGKVQKFKMREEAIEILKLQEAASIETA